MSEQTQREEQRRVRETLILQKVNGAQREAFRQKWPGQCEHIMRLLAERLQTSLRKDGSEVPVEHIARLSEALLAVYQIHRELAMSYPLPE